MTSRDLVKGIYITGLEDVTGSEMEQLVDAARTADDKGMRIVTTDTALDVPDVPNPNVELEGVTPTWWTRYKWVRIPFSGDRVREYNWNPLIDDNGDYLKWVDNGATADLAQATAESANANATAATLAAADAVTIASNALSSANVANTLAITASTAAELANNRNDNQDNLIASLNGQVLDLQDTLGEITFPLPITSGGTGSANLPGARANLGLDYTPIGHVFLKDSKNNGTVGGISVPGTWTKRVLNEKTGDVATHVTLNGDNTFDLVRGTYIIEAECPAYSVGNHQAVLFDETSPGTNHTLGSVESAVGITQSKSRIYAVVSIETTTKFSIKHNTEATSGTSDFGEAGNFGVNEIYTQVKIEILSRNPLA